VNTTREVSDLEKAIAHQQAWTRQQITASLLMAIPLVAGFVLAEFAPAALGNTAIPVGCAIGLTIGVCVIPKDFRSRSGSLTPAISLVTALWISAVSIAVFSLW
jgi:hypothetical protein